MVRKRALLYTISERSLLWWPGPWLMKMRRVESSRQEWEMQLRVCRKSAPRFSQFELGLAQGPDLSSSVPVSASHKTRDINTGDGKSGSRVTGSLGVTGFKKYRRALGGTAKGMAGSQSVEINGHAPEASIQDIIKSASAHDIQSLEKCIDQHSFPECRAVDVQDPVTGFTPLHAAIVSSKSDDESGGQILKFLLENGAIWNQVDKNDETPGCIAYRLNLLDLYQIMVDAGVRAEMLLSRLEEYEELEDEDDAAEADTLQASEETHQQSHTLSNSEREEPASSNYLSSVVSLSNGRLLDEQQNGVMMDWESGIMLQSADALLTRPGLKILNVGFGMGIVDTHIQNHANTPASHHIVEAHPDILSEMRSQGWMEKPNVVVHSGKWQEMLPQLAIEGETFDAIYFDTFAESYGVFRNFFSEHVISLLAQDGQWSFFNGMGADRQISYDVYQKVVELDLFEAGFDVEWTDVELPNLESEWAGVRRKYWNISQYRLPVCRFMD
jgi:type IV protein arginine methyltransferase